MTTENCITCGGSYDPMNDEHGVLACVSHLKAERDALKARVEKLEAGLEQVFDYGIMDWAKYNKKYDVSLGTFGPKLEEIARAALAPAESGEELRPEVVQRLRDSLDKPRDELLTSEEAWAHGLGAKPAESEEEPSGG